MSRAPEDLLTLALSLPHEAISGAPLLLGGGPPQFTASIAHRAGGIGLRQLGDVDTAIRQMRPALRLAEQSGYRRREGDQEEYDVERRLGEFVATDVGQGAADDDSGPASLGWLIAVSLEELDDGLGCGFGFLFGGVVAGSFQDEAGDVC